MTRATQTGKARRKYRRACPKNKRTGTVVWPSAPVDEAALAERFAAFACDTRDLTGRLFGDPLPTRAALAVRT